MIEDDIYRNSTQYRYWSYTPQGLAALRTNTNAVASDRVRSAIKRVRDAKKAENGDYGASEPQSSDIECLTVEEELQLVRWGCSNIIKLGEKTEPPIPFEIRATACQYLRRFYLTNSPMTYHPKQILMCALFLATKSDHFHISLERFTRALENVTEDDVKAPEFLLMQGLRFTLDVRHPTKGLEGGVMELASMARENTTFSEFATFMKEYPTGETRSERRVEAAAYSANKMLRDAGQMTDAYFLYTPSQIWLAALIVADEALAVFYLDSKIQHIGPALESVRPKVLATLKSCAELLSSYTSGDDPADAKKLKKIGRKLHFCQNPEKLDLVKINKTQKREGAEGSDAEKQLKKRKLERERLEKDGDVFGGELKKP